MKIINEESHMALSICIPTYNRGHTLEQLLKSIALEIEKNKNAMIEIIISDNASTDNTQTIVHEYKAMGLPIKYLKLEKNNGFGININNAVANATGCYCWLMGSDDLVIENTISNIINIQEKYSPDVIIGNALTNQKERVFLSTSNALHHINSIDSLSGFIDECTEISALFAFISSIIIKKSFWNSVNLKENIIAHPYTHQIRLMTAVQANNAKIFYLNTAITSTGSETNEWNNLIFNHFSLDCRTLRYIIESVFGGNEKIRLSISKLILRQYSPVKIILARAVSSTSAWNDLLTTLTYLDIPGRLLKRRFFDPAMYYLYRAVKMTKAIKNELIQKI